MDHEHVEDRIDDCENEQEKGKFPVHPECDRRQKNEGDSRRELLAQE